MCTQRYAANMFTKLDGWQRAGDHNLLSYKLLRVYPSTVIVKPANSQLPYSTHATTTTATISSNDSNAATSLITDSDFYYVPQLVIDSLQSQMQPIDTDFSLTASFKALSHYCKESDCDLTHAAGLANVLYNRIDEQNVCFQVVYRLYLSLVTRTSNQEFQFCMSILMVSLYPVYSSMQC